MTVARMVARVTGWAVYDAMRGTYTLKANRYAAERSADRANGRVGDLRYFARLVVA